jgi:hypothetical protein
MKRFGICAVFALLGCAFAVRSFAHDADGWDNHACLRLHQGITLTATTNAPAGATGKAELLGECRSGTNSAVLLVETKGLDDGTYTVSATDETGTNTFVLGTFDVGIVTNGHCGCRHPIFPVRPIGPFWTNGFGSGCTFTNGFNFAAWTNCVCQPVWTNALDTGICTNFAGLWTNWFATCSLTNRPSHHRTNEVQITGGSFLLPTSLSPTNVASVSIADSNSVVDLVGDFTSITNTVTCGYDLTCSITPGTNCPSIQGSATISFTAEHGREHGTFLLTAQGAPADLKYAVFVNGTADGTTRSDKHGNVTIKNLHQKDLTTVKTVVVTDANHNAVFSASF